MALADKETMSLSPLRLKLGCRVMVNRNLSRTVSNGSIGTVEAFGAPNAELFPKRSASINPMIQRSQCDRQLFPLLPIVRLDSGEIVQIPPSVHPVGFSPLTYFYGHDVFSVPLQLGYAFTVHKVQGLTLEGPVVLDCTGFFKCEHLVYVACSRVRSMDQLHVLNFEKQFVKVNPEAIRFVEGLATAASSCKYDTLPAATWYQRLLGKQELSPIA
jgi:hypothetical protein